MYRNTFSIGANPSEVWTVYIEDKSDMDKVADTAHLLFSGQHPLRRARKHGFPNVFFCFLIFPNRGFPEMVLPQIIQTGIFCCFHGRYYDIMGYIYIYKKPTIYLLGLFDNLLWHSP